MPTDICEAKRMLRKEILSKRRHLGEEICQTFGRQFAERIVGLDEYKAADTILCYASCKGEADTWKLIEKALEDGKRVALPRVTGPAEMHFRCAGAGCELQHPAPPEWNNAADTWAARRPPRPPARPAFRSQDDSRR